MLYHQQDDQVADLVLCKPVRMRMKILLNQGRGREDKGLKREKCSQQDELYVFQTVMRISYSSTITVLTIIMVINNIIWDELDIIFMGEIILESITLILTDGYLWRIRSL